MEQNETLKMMAEYFYNRDWATIGGRIEDYANEVESHGEDYTYWDIVERYKEEADFVWRGVLVFLNFGAEAYYDKDQLLKVFQAY